MKNKILTGCHTEQPADQDQQVQGSVSCDSLMQSAAIATQDTVPVQPGQHHGMGKGRGMVMMKSTLNFLSTYSRR